MKVDTDFSLQFRRFCKTHFLQAGKFAEHALAEAMEDYHFGIKALRILRQDDREQIVRKKETRPGT